MTTEWECTAVFMWFKDRSPLQRKEEMKSCQLDVEGQWAALHGTGGHFPHVSSCPQIL